MEAPDVGMPEIFGFTPDSSVAVTVDDFGFEFEQPTDDQGGFSTQIPVPDWAETGEYALRVIDGESQHEFPFDVFRPEPDGDPGDTDGGDVGQPDEPPQP